MKPRSIHFLAIFIVFMGGVHAQEEGRFAMPYYNQMAFNPATVGFRNCITASINGRFQSAGITGAPALWSFGLDMPIIFGKTKLNCIGFGIEGNGNYAGFSRDNGMRFSLSYRRMQLGPGDLSIGIDLGFATRQYVNVNWITPGGIPDPNLPPSNAAADVFDMGIGLAYAGDQFYAGVSCTHLNGGNYPDLRSRLRPHLYANGGGFIPLNTSHNWQLNPHGIVSSDLTQVNFDLGLNALHYIQENNGIIFGASYRFTDAVGANIGYARKIQGGKKGIVIINYHVDVATTRLTNPGATSHELAIRFCFPSKWLKWERVWF
jgi:type IX secretion system PorP/SprF family membrane protein